jgi:hypothetical protein
MTTTTVVTDDDVRTIAGRIARVPARYRVFAEPLTRVHRFYRIDPETLAKLLDLGLPHDGVGDARRFDDNDLKAVAMALPTRSPQRSALRAMADALAQGAGEPVVERTVTLQAQCPHPGHEGRCGYQLTPEVRHSPETTAVRRVERGVFAIDVRLAGGPEMFLNLSAAELALFGEAQSRLRFHRIPLALNGDVGFAAEHGLVDCRLATLFLAHRARDLGVEVQQATGLFLSRPFSPRHFWLRLRRDNGWVPADPFFLGALVRWGLLDAGAWPGQRVPRGAFWRVDVDPDSPLITHRGGAPASILTS